jgi:hypothetical protein
MIYFLRHPETQAIKIGQTSDYYTRLSQLIREHGDLELLGVMEGNRETETSLHRWFAEFRAHAMPGREWFRAVPELLEYIQENTHLNLPSKGVRRSVSMKPKMASRIPVSHEMHTFLTEFKNGLGRGVTFDELLYFLISRVMEKDEDPTLAGIRLRPEFARLKAEGKIGRFGN